MASKITWIGILATLARINGEALIMQHRGLGAEEGILLPHSSSVSRLETDVPSGSNVLSWAGHGDFLAPNVQPPPQRLPKWIPDNKPLSQTHWDTITSALELVQQQQQYVKHNITSKQDLPVFDDTVRKDQTSKSNQWPDLGVVRSQEKNKKINSFEIKSEVNRRNDKNAWPNLSSQLASLLADQTQNTPKFIFDNKLPIHVTDIPAHTFNTANERKIIVNNPPRSWPSFEKVNITSKGSLSSKIQDVSKESVVKLASNQNIHSVSSVYRQPWLDAAVQYDLNHDRWNNGANKKVPFALVPTIPSVKVSSIHLDDLSTKSKQITPEPVIRAAHTKSLNTYPFVGKSRSSTPKLVSHFTRNKLNSNSRSDMNIHTLTGNTDTARQGFDPFKLIMSPINSLFGPRQPPRTVTAPPFTSAQSFPLPPQVALGPPRLPLQQDFTQQISIQPTRPDFPDFGPPKGDDVVLFESEDFKETATISPFLNNLPITEVTNSLSNEPLALPLQQASPQALPLALPLQQASPQALPLIQTPEPSQQLSSETFIPQAQSQVDFISTTPVSPSAGSQDIPHGFGPLQSHSVIGSQNSENFDRPQTSGINNVISFTDLRPPPQSLQLTGQLQAPQQFSQSQFPPPSVQPVPPIFNAQNQVQPFNPLAPLPLEPVDSNRPQFPPSLPTGFRPPPLNFDFRPVDTNPNIRQGQFQSAPSFNIVPPTLSGTPPAPKLTGPFGFRPQGRPWPIFSNTPETIRVESKPLLKSIINNPGPNPTSLPSLSGLSSFRLPLVNTFKLPDMSFLNPLNLFRNNRGRQNKNSDSFLGSIFSKKDEVSGVSEWPNLKPSASKNNILRQKAPTWYQPARNSRPHIPQNDFINFNSKIENNIVKFHAPAKPFSRGTPNTAANPIHETLVPPPQTHYKNPGIKTFHQAPRTTGKSHTAIHHIDDSIPTHIHHATSKNQQTRTSTYKPNLTRTEKPKVHMKKPSFSPGAVINPQTNPARPSISSVTSEEKLGPTMIQFTLDDVMEKPTKNLFTFSDSISSPKVQSTTVKYEDFIYATNNVADERLDIEDFHNIKKETILNTIPHMKDHTNNSSLKKTITDTKTTTLSNASTYSTTESTTPSAVASTTASTTTKTSTSTSTTTSTTTSTPFQITTTELPVTTESSTTTPDSTTTAAVSQIGNTVNISILRKPSYNSKLPASAASYFGNRNNGGSYSKYLPKTTLGTTSRGTKRPTFNTVWGYTHPYDNNQRDSTNNLQNSHEDLNNSRRRVMIIEATPMPKLGESFPTVKYFNRYTTISKLNTVTTTPTPTPTTPPPPATTESAVTKTEFIGNTAGISPTTEKLPATKPGNNVLLPGQWNPLDVVPTSVALDSSSNEDATEVDSTSSFDDNTRMITQSQSRVRYTVPVRKGYKPPTRRPTYTDNIALSSVSNAHSKTRFTTKPSWSFRRPTTKTSYTTKASQSSVRPTTKTSYTTKASWSSDRPTTQPLTLYENLKKHNKDADKSSENSITTEIPEKTTTVAVDDLEVTAVIQTTTNPLIGRPSRYNSLERIREYLSRRRNRNSGETNNELVTTEKSITNKPKIIPSNFVYKPKNQANNTSENTNTSTISTGSFIANLWNAGKKAIPLLTRKHNSTISLSPFNFKNINNELVSSGSEGRQLITSSEKVTIAEPFSPSDFRTLRESVISSSSSAEWRMPMNNDKLGNNQDALELYNWESSRINDDYDSLIYKDNSDEKLDTRVLVSSSIPIQDTNLLVDQRNSQLAHNESAPTLTKPKYTTVNRTQPKQVITVEAIPVNTGVGSGAWSNLMSTMGTGESPQTHIIYSLHRTDPDILTQ